MVSMILLLGASLFLWLNAWALCSSKAAVLSNELSIIAPYLYELTSLALCSALVQGDDTVGSLAKQRTAVVA